MHTEPLGDRAVLIRLGDPADDGTRRRARAAHAQLKRNLVPGVIEIVPAAATIAVFYDPAISPYATVSNAVAALLTDLDAAPLESPRTVEVPVVYGGEHGPDLQYVAERSGLTIEEAARLHASGQYEVEMIGFAPGFGYLRGLDPRLTMPRHESPRTAVPAGSVGIGGSRTGVYPLESPGGWRIIGRTPLVLFDPARDPAALLTVGDRVTFRPITAAEFHELERAAQ